VYNTLKLKKWGCHCCCIHSIKNGISAGSFVIADSKRLRSSQNVSDSESKEVEMQFVLLSIDVAETTVTQSVAKILTFALSIRWRPE
jgi:hypothetical protein